MNNIIFIGRRKTSVCILRIVNDVSHKIINGIKYEKYFNNYMHLIIMIPINIVSYDIGFTAKICGGGISSQCGALSLAISRYLASLSNEYKFLLRRNDCLTCDSRMVESKKYGHTKSRRGHQRSKR